MRTAVQTYNELFELKERMKLKNHNKPLKKRQEDPVPGMMTDSMKRLAWFLAYRLEELDDKNIPVPANIRLAGAVKKVLGITADQSDPLVWIKFNEGMKLIEYMKRYVRSAELKAAKKAGG